jgi:hypothetical protein
MNIVFEPHLRRQALLLCFLCLVLSLNAAPHSAESRKNLLAVPFKAYVIGVPLVVLACRIVSTLTGQDLPKVLRYGAGSQIAREDHRVFEILTGGYVVCALALLLIGVAVLHEVKPRRSALLWSLVAMAIAALFLFGSQPAVMR